MQIFIQMQPGSPTGEDMFMDSKLFNEALSQQSSHYIQSKLMSLPREAQQLKKLDLRHMCDTVVKELEVVEKEAAYDYIKVSEELETLGKQLTVADNIMEELQNVLYNFKDHLESIKSEMTSLQEKSNKMNTSLSNKKKVQSILGSFIESALPDKELIDAICLSEINQAYVGHIKSLLKKLSCLNSNMITPDSKAVKELQPELQKLKAKASLRLRQFFGEQFKLLKKPKTNIQIVQKSVLNKYKVFTEFFKDQYPQIYTELCNNYREIMAKVYLENYKAYLQEIFKLQVELYLKTDQLLPNDQAHIRLFLPQIKPTNFNQDKKSIFTLMARDKAVDQNEPSDIILYSAASQKGQKFTIEQIFKSVNKALMDGVLNQVVFTAQFFNLRSEGSIELFGPLFRPSLNVFLDHIRNTVSNTYDIFGVMLILAINEKNKQLFHEKQFSALDFYFDQVSIMLWPRFEELFDFHIKPLMGYTPANFKRIANPKAVVDRFADFFLSLYRLYVYFPESKMIDLRLQNLRRSFFDLIKKVASECEKEMEGLSYHLNVLEQFHFVLTGDAVIGKLKKFQAYQNQLEKEIGLFATRIVGSYLHDFFGSLDFFIRKHCKDEQMLAEESNISIQGVVDTKTLEATLSDLSSQLFAGKLQKLLEYCEKLHSGYSLKLILRKFMGVFMKYYNEIYKYVKNHHGDIVNGMLLPHNMMKEIKNAFAKHNV